MYSRFILANVPRLLTQIDRDINSKTFGSCDRNHWHLRIRDFTSAILQQSALDLALVYDTDFPGNKYYKNENLKVWAKGVVNYWVKIQLRDGSFNEYYPHEHGFPPTAFSLYAVCETCRILGFRDENILNGIKKTVKYLSNHIEEKAYNQELASIAALSSAYELLKEEEIKLAADRKLERILKLQDEEGYFSEQGGADIGYLSVSLDMLAEYHRITGDERAVGPLNKVVEFLKYFVHQDGTIGGEYASRNTTYFMANGIEYMCSLGNESALAIRKKVYDNINNIDFFMNAVDERYMAHYVLHSYLRAERCYLKNGGQVTDNTEKLPCDKVCEKYFNNAGIYRKNNGNYDLIAGLKKGGVVKIFKNGNEIFADFGYRTPLKKKLAVTNWLDESYEIVCEGDIVKISGRFNSVGQKVQNPVYHFGIRVASFLLGNKVNKLMKKILIYSDSHVPVTFERNIDLSNENTIIITDIIKSDEKRSFYFAPGYSMRVVASGKFFSTTDLISRSGAEQFEGKEVKITQTVNTSEEITDTQINVLC